MAELEPPLYLFDEYALEAALFEGNDVDHQKISGWAAGSVCITKSVKEQFLDAYPEEAEKLAWFNLVRKHSTDNRIASVYGDQLQNLPDIDSRVVAGKILLLAMTSRMGAILVTAEPIGLTTWIRALAEQLNVPCITFTDFQEL